MFSAPAATHPCEVHTSHQPAPIWTHAHHVILKAWTDRLGLPEGRTVYLCPHGHDALHADLLKSLKGQPYSAGPKSRALIEEATAFYRERIAEQSALLALASELDPTT